MAVEKMFSSDSVVSMPQKGDIMFYFYPKSNILAICYKTDENDKNEVIVYLPTVVANYKNIFIENKENTDFQRPAAYFPEIVEEFKQKGYLTPEISW